MPGPIGKKLIHQNALEEWILKKNYLLVIYGIINVFYGVGTYTPTDFESLTLYE